MSENTCYFEILGGLPSVGEPAVQFSASGTGTHREGLVVGFSSAERSIAWVGNFQPGLSGLDAVFEHPNGTAVIVVAGGEVYIVDPIAKTLTENFGCVFETITAVPDLKLFIFGTSIDFEAVGPRGRVWRSGRIAIDGIRSLSVEGTSLRGEANADFGDKWSPFAIDVMTGRLTNGAEIPW